jgi:hypothetical protein
MIEWARRRWTDVRNGFSLYIGLTIGFVDFILLIRLNYPYLFPYTPLIAMGLVAIAGSVGYFHRVFQWGTDNNSAYEQAPLSAKITKVMLKSIQGTATKEEIEWTLEKLSSIEKNMK